MSFDLHLYFQILCASCCRLPQVVTIHGQEELIISGPVAITVAWREIGSCRALLQKQNPPISQLAKGGPSLLKGLVPGRTTRTAVYAVHPNGQFDQLQSRRHFP